MAYRASTELRTMIIGGTGLLGYHTARHLIADGHRVHSMSRGSVDVGGWYPDPVTHQVDDVFALSVPRLTELFDGFDVVIHAVGPDDRETPPRPASHYFQERLVGTTDRVRQAADKAGVRRLIVFGSYFTFLHGQDPGRRLADRHPYVAARVAQLERCCDGAGPSTAVFEIPYVFGTVPGREPMWNDVLVSRLDRMKRWLFFPPGGTAVASADYVGRAAAAASGLNGPEGPIPIGEQNIDWVTMLRIASEELYDGRRSVVTIPGRLASVYGLAQQLIHRLRGLESGLDLGHYITDVQSRYSYFPETVMASVAVELGLERGSVEPALRETFARCREFL